MHEELYEVFVALMADLYPAGTVLEGEQLLRLQRCFYAGVILATRVDVNSSGGRSALRIIRRAAERFDYTTAPKTLTVKEPK